MTSKDTEIYGDACGAGSTGDACDTPGAPDAPESSPSSIDESSTSTGQAGASAPATAEHAESVEKKPASKHEHGSSGFAGRKGHASASAQSEELEGALAEAREWKERAARAQAEFENSRKRLEAQQAEALGRATERVIEGLLPVVDDLDRAIAHGKESGSDLVAGLEAIREKLQGIFANEGVEVIDPKVGEPFDHSTQSALQVVENADLPDQSVSQVFQKGYRRGARVIRPAAVIVSKS